MKVFFKVLLILTPYIWKTKKSLYAAIRTLIYLILGTFGAVFSPILLSKILDLNNIKIGVPLAIFFGIAIAWIFQNISQHLSSISFYKVTNEAIKIIRFKTIMKIKDLSNLNLLKSTNSEIIYACERVPVGIVNFMNSIFIVIIPNIFCLISCWVSIIYLNKNLGTKYLFASLGSFLPSLFFLKYFVKSRHLVWTKGDDVRVSQNEILQNKFFSKTNKTYVEKVFIAKLNDEADAWYSNNNHNFILNILFDILFFSFSALFFLFFYLDLKIGLLEINSMVIFSSYIFTMHKASNAVINDMKNIVTSVVDLRKIVKILELPEQEKSILLEEKKINFRLVCENLCFFYESDKYVIKNLFFDIKKGEKIALVGKSGMGKSTLCKLISGSYQPNFGDIYLQTDDGKKSLDNITIEYVSQDCTLFSGTIRENLFMNGEGIPPSVKKYFQDRMDEKITELGKSLSIGERKRIVLARAIAKKSDLLILDEVFSGLDKNSIEDLVKETLEMAETLIICTHDANVINHLKIIKSL